MKAFVEFGRKKSDTKSTSHAEFKTWLKMVPYGPCFHFIGLCCYKALTVNADKTWQKTLFKGSSYKMPRVKNYFLVNIYFIYQYSKINKLGNAAFFQIRSA